MCDFSLSSGLDLTKAFYLLRLSSMGEKAVCAIKNEKGYVVHLFLWWKDK